MTPLDSIAILALVAYAVYRQTRISEVSGHSRFKLAIIYGAVGIADGGFAMPHGAAAYGLLGVSIALSVVVGLLRGRLTRVWMVEDGRILSQGTALTVALFLAMIAIKFGLGAYASLQHINDGEGFGEVLLMIAVMVAVQAELVWQRAQRLRGSVSRITLTV